MKSDTSVCSPESEGSSSDSSYPKIEIELDSVSQTKRVYNAIGISPCLPAKSDKTGANTPLIVSECQKSINIPAKCLQKDSQTSKTGETVLKSDPKTYQTLICSVEDFLAKHSQSLESGEDLKTLEVQCFLKLREYLKLKDLKLYSSKTSRAYSITKAGKLLESSFKRWMNWGMKFNGWYLTANFMESPKTERGYLLSEILEEQVDPKYFLLKSTAERLLRIGRAKILEHYAPNTERSQQTELTSEQFSLRTEQTNDKTVEGSKSKKSQVLLSRVKTYTELLSKMNEYGETWIIRRFTPVECCRLQGFPDDWNDKMSDTQRYKQMGNAVTTNVISAVGRRILNG